MNRRHIPSIIQALIAALLFGASAPIAKSLLGEVDPVLLAAFLYLGSGFGLLIIKFFQQINRQGSNKEKQINKADYLWLAGAILAGGVAAPIVLLFSLKSTPAATASLLLSFEGVATTLVAFIFFKESISQRAWLAIALIALASIFLAINLNAEWGLSFGALGIIAATFLWAIDNNFTRSISSKDPLTIVTIKGLAAGVFSLGLAIIIGNTIPDWKVILNAMLLGSLSYGLSIVLFIYAMRGLGAARTSALFSTAPITGIILSLLLFQELPSWLFLVALPVMFIGTMLLVNENHEHIHSHASIVHEHSHKHVEHHQHDHEIDYAQRHSHVHSHDELVHTHQHMPYLSHRHNH